MCSLRALAFVFSWAVFGAIPLEPSRKLFLKRNLSSGGEYNFRP